MKENKAQQLAAEIKQKCLQGLYQPGERLPSLRLLAKSHGVGLNTAYLALQELESLSLVQSRPKSGYFVCPRPLATPAPRVRGGSLQSLEVKLSPLFEDILEKTIDPRFQPFGGALLAPQLLPLRSLARLAKGFTHQDWAGVMPYGPLEGDREVRRQVALHLLAQAGEVDLDQLFLTNGCMEALSLALSACLKPGDRLAVEAACFHSLIPLWKAMGLLVVEIATHPTQGMDLDQLESLVRQRPIQACLVNPNVHNPWGFIMPEAHKARLAELAERWGFWVIEDNIYAELAYGPLPPKGVRHYDRAGRVLSCSSVSKVIAPGLRLGWLLAPAALCAKVRLLKATHSLSTGLFPQRLLGLFLESGAYAKHIQALKKAVQLQTAQVAQAVQELVPGARFALPAGGQLLWVELDKRVKSMELYLACLKEGFCVVPGEICSASQRFDHHLRINCGFPLDEKGRSKLQILGKLVEKAALSKA